MRLLAKIIVITGLNAVALWVASQYIPGFHFAGGAREFAVAAVILALLNFFIKPVLKLILGPIIILTLGLGLILVNALILYALTYFQKNLTIDGVPALLYGTLLITVVNFVAHLATKK